MAFDDQSLLLPLLLNGFQSLLAAQRKNKLERERKRPKARLSVSGRVYLHSIYFTDCHLFPKKERELARERGRIRKCDNVLSVKEEREREKGMDSVNACVTETDLFFFRLE